MEEGQPRGMEKGGHESLFSKYVAAAHGGTDPRLADSDKSQRQKLYTRSWTPLTRILYKGYASTAPTPSHLLSFPPSPSYPPSPTNPSLPAPILSEIGIGSTSLPMSAPLPPLPLLPGLFAPGSRGLLSGEGPLCCRRWLHTRQTPVCS